MSYTSLSLIKDKIRSLALPTSPTSVASLVAGVLFVLAIGSKRDSDSKLGFLVWNESVLKKDLPILKRGMGWFTVMNGGRRNRNFLCLLQGSIC